MAAVATEDITQTLQQKEGSCHSQFVMPPMEKVAELIKSPDTDIVTRMKALFQARQHGGPRAVAALLSALNHPSVLFKHEAAYVLGQLGDVSSMETLVELLRDEKEHEMVRHEAGEAIAAIGLKESIPILEAYLSCDKATVRETCELGVASLKKQHSINDDTTTTTSTTTVQHSSSSPASLFKTVDPMKGECALGQDDVTRLRQQLLCEDISLSQRYEALFSLRNLAADNPSCAAEDAIIESIQTDKASALFRHEVAFVLGQLQTPKSINALRQNLTNTSEHPMARHEAAFALGSVLALMAENNKGDTESDASPRKEAFESLQKFAKDPEPIVAESCLVALDNIRLATTA